LLSFDVNATDADGDPITYGATGLPSGASFAGDKFFWTPSNDQAGSYQVTFTASDWQATDAEVVDITVNNVNRAPVLTPIGNRSVDEGDLLTFSIQATDPDGQSVSLSATNLPSGASFDSPSFIWTPSQSQAGSYEVTFVASDGLTQDSETVAINVTDADADSAAPVVRNCSPAADSIQVRANSLVTLHVVDNGMGVDANTVSILVDGTMVYSGNVASYSSVGGVCRRTGSKTDYGYAYQADANFDFDEAIAVTVDATDLDGNAMTPYSYSFRTEMRAFGANEIASWGPVDVDKGGAATVRDSEGNIWAVWHAGEAGARDIYVSKRTYGARYFAGPVRLTVNAGDQSHPDIAVGTDDKLYVAWQDNRKGDWDIYVSTSADGATWSAETRVTDSNDNQVSPAIAVDGELPNRAYIAWQDDSAGHQDIYVASSTTDFVNDTVSQVTSDASDQIAPDIAVDGANTVYLVWTDGRNGSEDIYGAASNDGPWTNVSVVTGAGKQLTPVIAAEADGSTLHFAWVDDSSGDNDIYYASSSGLPASPLVGVNIVDDTSGADQSAPSIVITKDTVRDPRVFVCWQDERDVTSSGLDTDLYAIEIKPGSETNLFVGDGGTNSNQSEPVIGVDLLGRPYVVWTDHRNVSDGIYYAASTFVEQTPLESLLVNSVVGATIGAALPSDVDDIVVAIPAGACPYDVTMTVSRIHNLQLDPTASVLNVLPYEFGPSGLQFDLPVTITIPYAVADFGGDPPAPCWYDSQTGTLSQQGITDVETLEISDLIHALRFKTTHFTPYCLVEGLPDSGAIVGGGGSGGGCSLSVSDGSEPCGYFAPYMVLAIVMGIMRLRDATRTRSRRS